MHHPDGTPTQELSIPRATVPAVMVARRSRARTRALPARAELTFVSFLRVGAIAGVVLIHSLSGMVTNQAIRGSTTWWIGLTLSLGVSWAVPVFIMVSGTLLLAPRAGESPRCFYRRRLDRIAVPLVVAHVGYFLVRWGLDHESLTAARIVADLLHANVYPQLYFFWIVLGLYLVTPFLRDALFDRKRTQLALIGAAGIGFMWTVHAGAVLLGWGGATTVWQPAALVLWIPYLGYFLLGYALRDVVLTGRWLALAVGAFVIATAAVIWQYANGGGPLLTALIGGGYQGLPVATAAVAVFMIVRSVIAVGASTEGRMGPALRMLAELTLGVFVVHLLVLRFVRLLPALSYAEGRASIPVTLEIWAVTLLASFALCLVVARIPILRRTIGM